MAAKRSKFGASAIRTKAKKTRPGVHAKTKTSRSKNAKNYIKAYRGQGR